MIKIPSKQRKEWKDLVTGHLVIEFSNFFFRMKVEQTKNLISQGKITTSNAVNNLYKTCIELAKTRDISDDIEMIFGKDTQEKEVIAIVPTIENKKEKITITEDIHTRINKIQEEAALKRKAFQTKNTKPIKDINIIYENFSSKKEKKPLVDTKNVTIEQESEVKDLVKEKIALRKASIERRNKVLKENRDLLRNKDKNSLGLIIKSIFN